MKTIQDWQKDFSVCPDCKTKQKKKNKKHLDECEAGCETYVEMLHGELIWWSPNWG